ncbi:MAG: DUF4270 domain-containing protein [Bacteroidales bacterium]|nr:DUF4270 domain-containing protein [Bacteroidales bacterium]
MSFFKPLYIAAICSFSVITSFTSCDDDVTSIGQTILPKYDNITTTQAVYNVNTATLLPDSILVNNTNGYLGRLIDPITRVSTTSNYVAQYAVLDGFSFPPQALMARNDEGKIEADSVTLMLNFKSYQGDSLAPMRLGLYELSMDNPLSEGTYYYSNVDLSNYVDTTSSLNRAISYTLRDLTRPDSLWNNAKYYNSVRVKLPKSYGTAILNHYYTKPNDFASTYRFIRNVVPGFYFKVLDGLGAMMHIEHTALNVYFTYHTEAKPDSLIGGMATFAGTQEALQFTLSTNVGDLQAQANASDYTLIKSPGAAFTAVTLPVDSVFFGHETDSITAAVLSLPCLVEPHVATVSAPSALLLIRARDYKDFFEKRQIPNGHTAFLTTYNRDKNAYIYTNVANLMASLRSEYVSIGLAKTDTPEQYAAKLAAYTAANPDWNKAYLVPVEISYGISGEAKTSSLLSVRHASSVSSARLLRGNDNGALTLSVIYDSYK